MNISLDGYGGNRGELPIGILQCHRGKWNSVLSAGDRPNQLISKSWKAWADIEK